MLQTFSTGSYSEKRKLIRTLIKDILVLFNRKSFKKDRTLTVYSYSTKVELNWKTAGAKFLYNFYEQYLDSLPQNFWNESNKIGKKEIRQQILEENKNNLRVCPFCDFGNQEGQVDHYLPKSLYAHLSCHPFNLVPICYSCNSLDVKKDDDLLSNDQSERFAFHDILHLYIDDGLTTHTFLKINLQTKKTQLDTIEFIPLSKRFTLPYLSKYNQTYQISERWIKDKNKIGMNLFERLKENLQSIQPNPANKFKKPYLDIFDILYFLDSCLIDFRDKQGKIDSAFLMTWWLATLINQQIEPIVNSEKEIDIQEYPFLAEIASWLNQETIQHPKLMSNEMLEQARELRKIAQ